MNDFLKSDTAKYAGTGAAFGLIAKALGVGLIGTLAAAAGGVALAAAVIKAKTSSQEI